MREGDQYTDRVRKWQPVIDAVNEIKHGEKTGLARNCDEWAANYVTDPDWVPVMSDSPKAGAHRQFVQSPPGTDPATCKSAFIVYVGTKSAPGGALVGGYQTDKLYTCSIGSFNIYTTVDAIDCSAKTATMNFWMYNSMSKKSFGRFADNPVFFACGMKTQYMWWNWVERVEWTTGTVLKVPSPAPAENGWR